MDNDINFDRYCVSSPVRCAFIHRLDGAENIYRANWCVFSYLIDLYWGREHLPHQIPIERARRARLAIVESI